MNVSPGRSRLRISLINWGVSTPPICTIILAGQPDLEIIGEAARDIERHHSQFAAAHPEVPWSIIYTMRNRVAHGYFKVDLEIVWKTIHTDLNELHAQIRKLLEQLG